MDVGLVEIRVVLLKPLTELFVIGLRPRLLRNVKYVPLRQRWANSLHVSLSLSEDLCCYLLPN
ncbi:hypothetical protein L484_021590 [Morus notabilis]|uniref:Uncharacterized protein n=1 Tax=Morus notabilis TaxID=981085 RepID=W9S8H5_9ROSA|nr:hypothetical protein L484_021590 [Morus notabilis]